MNVLRKIFKQKPKEIHDNTYEKELTELNNLFNEYEALCIKVVKLYPQQNSCFDDKIIKEINQHLTVIVTIEGDFKSKYREIELKENENEFFSLNFSKKINILGEKFQKYQEIMKKQNLQFNNKCKKEIYINEHPGSEFVNIINESGFDQTSNYYIYNLDNNIELTKLGKFVRTEQHDESYIYKRTSSGGETIKNYIFNNNGKEGSVDSNQKEFLKENDSTEGGKPKKSRRQKNKKRRSSRRKN